MNFSDERGVIADWLVKITLVVALVGLVLYVAVSVGVNFFTLDTSADDIAFELSSTVGARPANLIELRNEGRILARDAHARLVHITVDEETARLRVTLRRPASTLVLQRLRPLRHWGLATATGSARTD